MAVGKARHGSAAIQVNHLRGRSCQRFDNRVRTYRDNFPVPHRHRLGNGMLNVHRENPSVAKQQICR
jgi:hypothetical protein